MLVSRFVNYLEICLKVDEKMVIIQRGVKNLSNFALCDSSLSREQEHVKIEDAKWNELHG